MNLIFGNNIPSISENESTLPYSLNSKTIFDSEIIFEINNEITCHGDEDGELSVSISVNDAPCAVDSVSIVYEWMKNGNLLDNETSNSLENIGAGEYQIAVFFYNPNGTLLSECAASNTIIIEEPNPVTVSFDEVISVRCNGGSNGRAKAIGAGGTGNYSYSWNNGTTTINATGLVAEIYTVTLTDANGCTGSNTITIEEPESLIPNIIVINHVPCSDGVGILEVNPEGGTPNYSYNWTNGSDSNPAQFETQGTYSVTITDSNDCSVTASEELILGTPPQISSFPDFLTFQHSETTQIEYISDLPEATLVWEILNPINIDTSISSFMFQGENPNPIPLTLSLEEDNVPGSITLRVYPKINLCIGNPVETTIHIYPEGNPIHVPEIFSPNDDGTNDTWEIAVPQNDNPDNYCINVYSQNGQKVYEAKSLEILWTGKGCHEGAYYYIIENKMDKSTFRGVVSILR